MELQHWSIINLERAYQKKKKNLERVNWEIYLVNNLSTLLSFQISQIWEN